MGFSVTGITVSVEISDTEYGNGVKRFVSLKSESQDPLDAIPLKDLEEVIITSLDLLKGASEAVHGSRYAQGEISAKELQGIMIKMDERFDKVKKALGEVE